MLRSGSRGAPGENADAERGSAPPAVAPVAGRPGFDGHGWPILDEMAAAIAQASVPMVLERPLWVHRRVEKIVFLGDSRILRRISIDFTLPDFPDILAGPGGAQRVAYVPLSLLDKDVLENFDLRDEAGDALCALGQSHHDLIARRMLVGVARDVVSRSSEPQLDEVLAQELETLVAADPRRGTEIRSRWESLAQASPDSQRGAVWNDSRSRALMTDLSHLFILFVPLTVEPGQRRVVKFSFEQDFRSVRPDEPPGETRAERRANRRARLSRALLLAPWRFVFAVPIGGQAASCHIELPAPEDLLIVQAGLVPEPTRTTTGAPAFEATELAHLHPEPVPRSALHLLTVDFRLRASGVLSAALLIASLTSLMLVAGVLLHFVAHVPVRADAAGAVVVVAPAVFAPFIAISVTHRLVRQIVSTLRILVVAAAAISFGAAASLVAAFPKGERQWIWVGLLLLSLGPSVLLWVSWRQAREIERTASLTAGRARGRHRGAHGSVGRRR